MTQSHTPTPWHASGKIIMDTNGIGRHLAVAHETTCDDAEANAAFIVRACNAHDDLVEALQILLAQIGEYKDGEGVAKLHAINIAKKAVENAQNS